MNKSHNVSSISSVDHSYASTPFDIFITSMTCLVFFPLLFGNCLTVMAYIKFSDLRSNTTLLISSMAVSDLAVGVFYITTTWYVSHIVSAPSRTACKVIFVSEDAVCMTSLFHLVALNSEKYIQIAHPFFYSRSFTKRVSWIIIAGIYVTLAMALMIINSWFLRYIEISTECIASPNNKYTSLVIPLIWFGLPLGMISVMCAAIYRIVNRHLRVILEQRAVTESDRNKQEPVKTNKRTIQTIVAVLLAFGLTNCLHRVALSVIPFLEVKSNQKIILHVLPVTNILLMINSAVNPVIYGLLFPRYKQAYKNILTTKFHRNRNVSPEFS